MTRSRSVSWMSLISPQGKASGIDLAGVNGRMRWTNHHVGLIRPCMNLRFDC